MKNQGGHFNLLVFRFFIIFLNQLILVFNKPKCHFNFSFFFILFFISKFIRILSAIPKWPDWGW
jgi:hypothetical protein